MLILDYGCWIDNYLHNQCLSPLKRVVSLNPAHGEVYSIQHFVIKLDRDYGYSFIGETDSPFAKFVYLSNCEGLAKVRARALKFESLKWRHIIYHW